MPNKSKATIHPLIYLAFWSGLFLAGALGKWSGDSKPLGLAAIGIFGGIGFVRLWVRWKSERDN